MMMQVTSEFAIQTRNIFHYMRGGSLHTESIFMKIIKNVNALIERATHNLEQHIIRGTRRLYHVIQL